MTFSDLSRNLPRDATNLAFELTQTRLLCVLLNDGSECRSRNVQIARADPVLFHLLRQEMSDPDLTFFFLGVPGEPNYLHSIPKRWLNRFQNVCSCHEDNV